VPSSLEVWETFKDLTKALPTVLRYHFVFVKQLLKYMGMTWAKCFQISVNMSIYGCLIFSILQKLGLQKLHIQVMFLSSINSFKMKWSNALHRLMN